MTILLIGLFAVFAVVFASRLYDRRNVEVLSQYETLEKRFGLRRRVFKSRWGKGIGERNTLEGEYHGYNLSLYSHFNDKDKNRVVWTSLVFETLFTGDLEFDIEMGNVAKKARFPYRDFVSIREVTEDVLLLANQEESELPDFISEKARDLLAALSLKDKAGAIRLSKGFLEYRELGELNEDAMRLRFQEAFICLSELADGLVSVTKQENVSPGL